MNLELFQTASMVIGLAFGLTGIFLLVLFQIWDRQEEKESRLAKEKRRRKKKLKYPS